MKRTRKNQKLPNGFGSIVKRVRNNKEEFRVYAPAIYDANKGKYIQPSLGVVESYNDGYKMLIKYHDNPYEIENKDITFGIICEKALDEAHKSLEKEEMSSSNYSNLKIANKKIQQHPISKIKIQELKKISIQAFMDEQELGYTSKNYIINIINRAFNFASDFYDIKINIDTKKINIGKKMKSNKFKPIEDDDIQLIFNSEDTIIKKIIILSIYTGTRPNEILKIENKNVFINERYIIGGSKTEAGKNRIIPIHENVVSILEELYNPSKRYLFDVLRNNKSFSLKMYEKGFKSLMSILKIDDKGYYPYCTRHTFATKADECKFNDNILKAILGHSLKGDITNDVYIHRKKETIIKEINKLDYKLEN